MNNEHSFQPNPLLFGIGTIIGLALGLFIGWVLWPVEWEGAALRDLDTGTKAEYVAAVADAFVIYDSPEAATNARRRLIPLEDNLTAELSNAIVYFRNSGQAEQNIRISNIRQLASALGVLLPESGFTASGSAAPAAAGPIPPAGVSTATTGANAQVTSGSGTGSNMATGSDSWLRSLLWLLAVLLIVGGAVFLLSASGLVDWQRLMERWAAFPTTERVGRRNGSEDGSVDEFDDADYTPFDEGSRFHGSYEQEYDDDYDGGFDEEDEEGFDDAQRNTARYATDRIERPPLHFGYQGRTDSHTTAFDAEEYPRTSGEDVGNSTSYREPFTDDPSAFAFDRLQRRAEGKVPPVIDSTIDNKIDRNVDNDIDNDIEIADMFEAVDFDEAEETADDRGYQIAYAGNRYADDLERAEAERTVPLNDDNDQDDDDDTAGEDWRVPTVDSVLAGSSERARFRVHPPTVDKRSDREEAEASAREVAASEEDVEQQAQSRQQSNDVSTDKPTSSSSPFARLTNRQPAQRVIDRKQQANRTQTATGQSTAAVEQDERNKRPAQSPGHTPRARYKVIDQLTLQYQLGIQEYDESKPIVDPTSGKYIGEFGMGASVKNGLVQNNPEQVAALEVWLFDKSDEESIGNKTRILLSEYAIDNKLDENILKERQDNPRPFTAQKGVHFQLESKNLLLDCMIIDVNYIDSGSSKGMFQSIKVDMSVHQKA